MPRQVFMQKMLLTQQQRDTDWYSNSPNEVVIQRHAVMSMTHVLDVD